MFVEVFSFCTENRSCKFNFAAFDQIVRENHRLRGFHYNLILAILQIETPASVSPSTLRPAALSLRPTTSDRFQPRVENADGQKACPHIARARHLSTAGTPPHLRKMVCRGKQQVSKRPAENSPGFLDTTCTRNARVVVRSEVRSLKEIGLSKFFPCSCCGPLPSAVVLSVSQRTDRDVEKYVEKNGEKQDRLAH